MEAMLVSLLSRQLTDDCQEMHDARFFEGYSHRIYNGTVDLLLQYLTRLARVFRVRGADRLPKPVAAAVACRTWLVSGRRNAGENARQSDAKGGFPAPRDRI